MLAATHLIGFGAGGSDGPPAADNTLRSPSNMTSDSAPSPFVAAASSVYGGGYEAYKAFDGDPGGSWAGWTSGSVTLSIDLGAAYWLAKYEIRSRQLNQDHDPTAWTLQGSSDNSNWTTVDTQSGISWAGGPYLLKSFTISDVNRLNRRYWRVNFSASTGALIIIQELKLYT